jgi:hypothetical protein
MLLPIIAKRTPLRLLYLANGMVDCLFTLTLIVLPHAPWGFLDLGLEPVERCEASVSVSSEFRVVRRQTGS